MNKQFALLAVLALFLFSGCNNSAKQNQKSTSEEETTNVKDTVSGEEQTSPADESPAVNEASNAETSAASTYTVEAKFEMMIANTAGTHYVFSDESGNEYDLFPTNETEGLEFANSLRPGDTSHKYNGDWYLLTVKDRVVETPGGEIERSFVLKASREKGQGEVGEDKWDSESLKNIVFSGVEPNWSFKLKDNYAEFTEMGMETQLIKYEPTVPGITPTLSDFTENSQQEVLKIDGTIDGETYVAIRIKEESCSDGMSDNTYPYTIKIEFRYGSVFEGCGQKAE
jgi:uncharacterized membrane protein/outer membrane murein-binding lipoprotein Lpp